MKKEVYLDYAATTPVDARVRRAMESYFSGEFGNPSSIHDLGKHAKEAMDEARKTVARILHCRPSEIVFTGGGTEAINLAILGLARAGSRRQVAGGDNQAPSSKFQAPFCKGHIITTAIEHHAVLRSVQALEKQGFDATYIPVDSEGVVNPEDIEKALRPDTFLVSVMYASNEIGTIQPIAGIGKIIKNFRNSQLPTSNSQLFFHSDACQAAAALDLSVDRLGVDLMALNGSKIYGPKGVGCLYVRIGTELEPILYGGGQERGLRSGTENVPGIVGFAQALAIAQKAKEKENARLTALRDYCIKKLLAAVPGAVLNGHPTLRLPNNVNVSIPGIEGEAAVIYLSQKGVYASTGSACSSVSLDPSHVIAALGKAEEYTDGSLRFTLGRATLKKDIDYMVKALAGIAALLRK